KEFVDAWRDKNTAGFKVRYRAYDVLLVDDIQVIEGKDTLQEELFHTFNSLYGAGKQIVISSARQPRELATTEARLQSRFDGGLAAASEWFGVTQAALRGDKRPQPIAYPRHIAMYLCRELPDQSLPKIGAKFGGRDHSTVMHGVRRIGDLIREDRDVFNVVQELTARIKRGR